MNEIPDLCDCVWAISEHADGSRSGCIHIASERCQRLLMHPRTFTTNTSGPPLVAPQPEDG